MGSFAEQWRNKSSLDDEQACRLNQSLARQLMLAQISLASDSEPDKLEALHEQVIMQGLKGVSRNDLQRRAVSLFHFPAELFNQMSGSHWEHWGADVPDRPDYPLQETILMWQDRILDQLFSPLTLQRVADNESKTPADQEAFTVVELISRMTSAIFSEVDTIQAGKYTPRQPAISGLRRNLERSYLKRLSTIVLDRVDVPDDAAAVASAELASMRTRIVALLAGNVELGGYSKAPLQDTTNRIEKILDARFTRKT